MLRTKMMTECMFCNIHEAHPKHKPPPQPPRKVPRKLDLVVKLDTMVMTTDWRCDSCHQTVESGQIRSILKDLEIQTRGLNKDDIPSLKSLLKKYSGALHRNHTLVTEVKQLLVSGLGRSAGHGLEELSDAKPGWYEFESEVVVEVADRPRAMRTPAPQGLMG